MTTKEKIDALHGLRQQIRALEHRARRLETQIQAELAAQLREASPVVVEASP